MAQGRGPCWSALGGAGLGECSVSPIGLDFIVERCSPVQALYAREPVQFFYCHVLHQKLESVAVITIDVSGIIVLLSVDFFNEIGYTKNIKYKGCKTWIKW